MNKLDKVIVDHYNRIESLQGDPLQALQEAQDEILAVATPELTVEILSDSSRTYPLSETRSTNATLRAWQDPWSIMNRTVRQVQTANGLARLNMLEPNQGYVGGIVFDQKTPVVFGMSMIFRGIKEHDPIQQAMGDIFYPPMMWVKALRAAAYKNRPESALAYSTSEYLAKLGLSLGCIATQYGDVIGATGFMPGERLRSLSQVPIVESHVQSEPQEAFRLSGLCDQAVVDPNILTRTGDFAKEIIGLGGTLN